MSPPSSPLLNRRSFLTHSGTGALALGVLGGQSILQGATPAPAGAKTRWPRVYVKRYHVTSIFNDGRHNAFPGMARVGNYYYVAFRNAIAHQSEDGTPKIIVIRAPATDLTKWDKVAEFTNPRDIRDPLVFDNHGKVQVVFHSKKDFYSQSVDGLTWSPVRDLETEIVKSDPSSGLVLESTRRWLFRIRRGPDGAFYSLARCGIPTKGNRAKFGLIMYRSEDGVRFKAMHTYGEGPAKMLTEAQGGGHEADIGWAGDGTFIAAIRNSGRDGTIVTGKSPLGPFRTFNTGTMSFGGPALHTTKKGAVFVAGRHTTPERFSYCRVSTVMPDGVTDSFLLPSGGDCAYQSFVDGPDDSVILCYYSSHEHPQTAKMGANAANIYLAHFNVRYEFPN